MFPGDVLLENIGFPCASKNHKDGNRGVANAGACLPTMEKRGFVSPHHLNLRLVCMLKTPVKERLDVWPALSIVIVHCGQSTSGVENTVAALKHSNRISGSLLETVTVSEAMQTWFAW
jgi:hypothetical protein